MIDEFIIILFLNKYDDSDKFVNKIICLIKF